MKKIALLSNVNIDPLKNMLKADSFSLFFAGFNQWQASLLNQFSELYTFEPDIIFIYLNAEELKSGFEDLLPCIDYFCSIKSNTQFIVSNLSYPPYSISTYLSNYEKLEININKELKKYAKKKKNLFVLDFNRLISYHGYNTLFDDKYWYLGRIKFSNTGFRVLASELNNVLMCIQGNTKKVLILDLDNTLWGGIVAEDGWQNLKISEEGVGKIYSDFQRNLKQLSQSGILLALCSKNNEEDAHEAFDKNPNMILNWDDFVVKCINWNKKSENIYYIASALNLGIESMVFIDDNPVEREQASMAVPGLIVPAFPNDVSGLNRWFVSEVAYAYFSKYILTVEDSDKINQYKRNIERSHSKYGLNYNDFIQQLGIKLQIDKANSHSIQRIAQLTQKTNQFNLSLNRYQDFELGKMNESNDWLIYSCSYEDKFGKEGIIGCTVLNLKNEYAILDSFMLSCRVLCRDVEFSFLDFIVNELVKYNVKRLEAVYKETTRNKLIYEFLLKYGFIKIENGLFIKELIG